MTVTAKTAISHLRGTRTIMKGLIRAAEQLGGDTSQLVKKLANLEYAEATLFAVRNGSGVKAGGNGLKAGVEAGFVPYDER